MKAHRIKYLPLAAVLISVAMLTLIVLGIGITQGRINSVKTYNFVYSPQKTELESNYLANGGQSVLLEKWEIGQSVSSRTESISLSSTNKDISGNLTCSTNSSLITASLDKTNVTADKNGVSVSLTLTLTDSALSLNKITEVMVYVGWIPTDSADGVATHWAYLYVEICPLNAENEVNDATVGFSSNLLASGGNTVLLNDWTVSETATYRTHDIEFITYNGEISGTLTCQSDLDYLGVSLDNSSAPVRITVSDTNKCISVFRMSLSSSAVEITQKTKATVRVSWTPDSASDGKPTMWADFIVNIIPMSNSSENPDDTTDSVDTVQLDLSECPSTFSWNSTFKVPIACPEGSDMIELTYNGGAFPVGTGFSSDGKNYIALGNEMPIKVDAQSEETVGIWLDFSDVAADQEISEIILGAVVYSNGSEVAEGQKAVVPYYKQEEEITMFENGAYPSTISFEEIMLLRINVPSNSTSLMISYNGGSFPSGVRYKVDSESYVLSEREEGINISVEGRSSIDIYIDFSNINLKTIPDKLSFTATAYKGIYELSSEEIQCNTSLVPISATYDVSQMIIHHKSSVSLQLTGENENTILKVQQLSSSSGQIAYVEDYNNFGLTVKVENGVLSISNEAGKAKAGTYRIILIREQNGAELSRVEIPFFIHY